MQKSGEAISVVIISKNEVKNIEACIHSASSISEDLILVDSFSSDGTQDLAKSLNCKVIEAEWQGYGNAKNLGANKAKNDWIFSLDADERIDPEVSDSIKKVKLESDHLYGFRRMNHIGCTPIKHGEWNPDTKFRLYNRNTAKWNLAEVHEEIVGPPWLQKTILPGYILHYSYENTAELAARLEEYARLGAVNMYKNGISPGILSFIKPVFRFIKGYYLKGGFLDGKLGYSIAKANADAQRKKLKIFKELEIAAKHKKN